MKSVKDGYLTDSQLVELLESDVLNREKYQTELYFKFLYMIKAGAKKYNMSEDKAASAYSETIIAVIKNILTSKYEARSSLQTYIHSIYWNKCVDELRSDAMYRENNRRTVIAQEFLESLPDGASDIVKSYMKKEDRENLLTRLVTLGAKCQQILTLWSNHYKDQEIADIMDYSSAKSARVSRFRCIEKLQKEITKSSFNYE